MRPKYISFFHNSDDYREEFTHRDLSRPCFYWFSDRFHSHFGYKIKDKYFYLFIKDPIIENISMHARHGHDFDFNDLYSHFLDYQKISVQKLKSGELKYAEPSIIMSFDKIIPDLIAKYHEGTNEYEVIKPVSHTGFRFKLYDDVYKHIWALGIPFTEIPELVDILPILKESLPFQKPELVDGKYIY